MRALGAVPLRLLRSDARPAAGESEGCNSRDAPAQPPRVKAGASTGVERGGEDRLALSRRG